MQRPCYGGKKIAEVSRCRRYLRLCAGLHEDKDFVWMPSHLIYAVTSWRLQPENPSNACFEEGFVQEALHIVPYLAIQLLLWLIS
jgi:hypothetical protein